MKKHRKPPKGYTNGEWAEGTIIAEFLAWAALNEYDIPDGELDRWDLIYEWQESNRKRILEEVRAKQDSSSIGHWRGRVYEVVPHPHSSGHLLFKVTDVHGHVFACASAWEPDNFPAPNFRTVMYHWRTNRKDFLPYNESTGTFT